MKCPECKTVDMYQRGSGPGSSFVCTKCGLTLGESMVALADKVEAESGDSLAYASTGVIYNDPPDLPPLMIFSDRLLSEHVRRCIREAVERSSKERKPLIVDGQGLRFFQCVNGQWTEINTPRPIARITGRVMMVDPYSGSATGSVRFLVDLKRACYDRSVDPVCMIKEGDSITLVVARDPSVPISEKSDA